MEGIALLKLTRDFDPLARIDDCARMQLRSLFSNGAEVMAQMLWCLQLGQVRACKVTDAYHVLPNSESLTLACRAQGVKRICWPP